MTYAKQDGMEWVPAIGMLEELPSEHAAVIRGLFELAAFVADHPEFRAPVVQARFYLPWDQWADEPDARYADERCLVDRLASALGVEPTEDQASGHYTATRSMGGVQATSTAVTPERWASYHAEASYRDCAEPARTTASRTGHATAADTTDMSGGGVR